MLPALGRVETMGHHDLYGANLLCPTCGYDYAHVATVLEVRGSDYHAWSGRGNALAVVMHGECGHTWAVGFGFHKGQTFLFSSELYGQEQRP